MGDMAYRFLLGEYQSNSVTSYFLICRMILEFEAWSQPRYDSELSHINLHHPVSVPPTFIICVEVRHYDIFSDNEIQCLDRTISGPLIEIIDIQPHLMPIEAA
jgi:hypothetical protein